MINFTVGPVQSSEEVRKIGYEHSDRYECGKGADRTKLV